MSGTRTPDEVLQVALRREPGRPVIIWYGPGGARIELSTKSYANAVAKAANLLAGELEPADPVRIDLPLHWQAGVWLAACAAGGWPIVIGDEPVALTLTDDPARVQGRCAQVSLDPFGRPVGSIPHSAVDVAREVPGMPDQFFAAPLPDPDDEALRLIGQAFSGRELIDEAVVLAARLGLSPGDRFTTTLAPVDLPGVLGLWLLPLLTGTAAVLLADPTGDPAPERPVVDLATTLARES